MSYSEALTAAGAEVLDFKYFGSYQGDWFALVNYQGTKQWVHGSYGSCSVCDAFESEFNYSEEACEEHRYDHDDTQAGCAECKSAHAAYQQKLVEFGRHYLNNTMTQEEAEKSAGENIEWDSDAPEMLAYVQANAIPKVPFELQLNDRS
jgi:hypothetical protein